MSNELTIIDNAIEIMRTQKTPKNAIKTRKGKGGRTYDYVSHAWVTMQLNEAFQWRWSFEVLEQIIVPNLEQPQEVVVKGQLTVHAPEGDWTKVQFGGADVEYLNCPKCKNDYNKKRNCNRCNGTGKSTEMLSLADNLKSASSDCLKKCASLFGIAIDLYGGDDLPQAQGEQTPQQQKSKTKDNDNKPVGPTEFWGEFHSLDPKLSKDEGDRIVKSNTADGVTNWAGCLDELQGISQAPKQQAMAA